MPQASDGLRILYVDDDALNLRLMRDVFSVVLQRPGVIATAASAEEALQQMADCRFQLVISDQRMPGMLGTQLLERVRAQCPACHRVLLTGYPGDREVAQALSSGLAEAVVAKPWKPRELERTIGDLLAKGS